MNTDLEKITELKKILKTQDRAQIFQAVSLTLSIRDDEDRDLYLLETVRWLVKNGTWQKAYGTAQLMSESCEKSEALQSVAEHLSSIGHLEKAFAVFDEAEKVSSSENLSEWQQAELLHKIAKSLYQIRAFYKADEIWAKAIIAARRGENSNPQDSLDASGVLGEIAEYLASKNKIEKALNIAQNVKSVGKKERVLRRIAEYSQNIKRVA